VCYYWVKMPAGVLIDFPELEAFSLAILAAAGMPEDRAALVAESLVAANLRAVDSHGVQLIPHYLPHLEAGFFNLTSDGRVVSETPTTMVYDGENGVGQWIAGIAAGHASRLACRSGLGLVTVRNSNHIGMAAFWALHMVERGQIGVVFTNATPLVAPWQGRERRLSTNPICMAVPGGERPAWLLDMATTTVAMGKIMRAVHKQEPELPYGWALDNDGRPTTSTAEALDGFLMPLGGYKGYGLAMMVEILCSVLSGGLIGSEVGDSREGKGPIGYSQCFLAIEVGRFMSLPEFGRRMDHLIGLMKSAAPAEGYDEVMVAGEPEWRAEQTRRREGIPIDDGVWSKLLEAAERLGVAAPCV
jgi:LDH2 family malate/lactate/ureidoglycolate dehydrogenase